MATGFSLWESGQVQKVWALQVITEAMDIMALDKFTGTDINSIIQKRTDLQKDKGDRITFDILIKMSGSPITGNNELKGNEKKLVFYQDTAIIDMARDAFVKHERLENLKSQKNMLELGKQALKSYFAEIMDEYGMRALCGDTALTYSQTGTAPTVTRSAWGGDASADNNVGTNDWLGVYEISRVKVLAQVASPRFRGVRLQGKEHFVMFIHPYQTFQLKQDAAFTQAMREALPRSEKDNPLFNGLLAMWDGVALYEDENVLLSYSTNVRRAVLCGAQAACMPFGGGPFADEDHDDYGERHGVGLSLLWGIKKTVFNAVDYATYTIATYAPAPAAKSHT